MNKDVMINVTNRSHSSVGYPVPDNANGLTRQFAVGETKQISFDELQKLSWMPGGMYLLQNCLVIKNEEAVSEILGDVEPEYYYSEQDVRNLLENGTIDQLLDCLDYGTDGVIDLLTNLAVELEIPDMRKRTAIMNKTGFNINRAIELRHEDEEDEVAAAPPTQKARRAAPMETSSANHRRTAAPKYKVVGE